MVSFCFHAINLILYVVIGKKIEDKGMLKILKYIFTIWLFFCSLGGKLFYFASCTLLL